MTDNKITNYIHYTRINTVSATEAVSLIAKIELGYGSDFNPDEYDDDGLFQKEVLKVERILQGGLVDGTLVYTPSDYRGEYIDGHLWFCLDLIYLKMVDLCSWAHEKKYNLPDELKRLISSDDLMNGSIQNNEKTLRASQRAKLKCQAIAQTLWHHNSELTIQEIVDHHAIQEFGDGKIYTGKNTVRDWVSEFDPRPADKKTGPKRE